MKRLVTALAFLSSLASLIVIAGGGLTLLAIENSGERGAGALLALGGAVAFAAVLALIFAKEGAFGEGVLEGGWRSPRRSLARSPSPALAFVAIRFAGLPFGSRMPLVDWTVLAIGILFAARRDRDSGARPSPLAGGRRGGATSRQCVHMQQIRHAQQQLRSAFEADSRRDEPATMTTTKSASGGFEGAGNATRCSSESIGAYVPCWRSSCCFAAPADAHMLGERRSADFQAGFEHPLFGYDHLLAMLAVGIWGAQMGGRRVWTLPVTFPLIMALGGIAGMAGLYLPRGRAWDCALGAGARARDRLRLAAVRAGGAAPDRRLRRLSRLRAWRRASRMPPTRRPIPPASSSRPARSMSSASASGC